jgi:ketosteroid isomerase-like protein
MASVYTNDAYLLPPNTERLRGATEIECFWRGGIEMGIRSLELETLQLEQADGLAYEIGRYTLCFEKEQGVPVTDRARYVLVHRRQPDGSWLRAVEIFNWIAPLA